jgi:ABC-type antimicrobial peptide transport system permease subunit
VRRTIAEIDPALPVLRVETLSDHIGEALRQDRVVATLATLFALLALVLTSVGLYGLMAYFVQRRTSEIGIRMALGAASRAVIGLVIGDAFAQTAAGIAIGIPIAFGFTRVLASQLYGVSPWDPQYTASAALVLIACLAAAAYLPARRASQIDPIRTLRQE